MKSQQILTIFGSNILKKLGTGNLAIASVHGCCSSLRSAKSDLPTIAAVTFQ